jgi:hypothetical protein
MQEEQPDDLTAAQREVVRALQTIHATTVRLDPTAAAFIAGRQSARRRIRVWQSAAAAMLLLDIGSHLLPPAAAPTPAPHVEMVVTTEPMRPLPSQSVLMLQDAVRKKGLAGLSVIELPTATSVRPGNNL